VPLFERMGYMRYTKSSVSFEDSGLLIPMVMPATDVEHLRRLKSVCLPAAERFSHEPHWHEWLRAACPMIGVYYAREQHDAHGTALAHRNQLPLELAVELSSMGFAHHFPAGAVLRRIGERITRNFLAVEGDLSIERSACSDQILAGHAPDGAPSRASPSSARRTLSCSAYPQLPWRASSGATHNIPTG
jgi:hypothetical protein